MKDPQKNPNGDLVLNITIPSIDIAKELEKQIVKAVSEAEITGFRKGKAPRTMVEPMLKRNILLNEVAKVLIPQMYQKHIDHFSLKPIVYPKITIKSMQEDKDWEVEIITCERPQVKLPDYKKELKGKDFKEDVKLNSILEWLLKNTQVNIPDILVEEEANHRTTHLVENITRLGMTTDAYLKSKKLTPETFKADMANVARIDLQSEFILSSIQAQENLSDRKSTLDFLLTLL